MKRFDVFKDLMLCPADGVTMPKRPLFFASWKDGGYGNWSNSTASWKDSGGWSNSTTSWKDSGFGQWSNSSASWKDHSGWSNSTASWKDSGGWSNSSGK